MAKYDFCHTITDEKLGIGIVYDIECQVDLSVEMDAGVPAVSVDGVYLDGKDMMRGGTLAKLIAAEIAGAAEDDDDLISRAIADEGFFYVGMGGNDPDGHYRRAL